MTRGALVTYRTLSEPDRAELARLLRENQPEDAYLLHLLLAEGTSGFHGCFQGERLIGALWMQRGALCASAATSPLAARVLASRLRDRLRWSSVVGPEVPCSAIVAELSSTDEPPRLDRVQTFMAAGRDARLAVARVRLEPARLRDVDELVPLVARYRVEDRLAHAEDDHTEWIRTHVTDRVREERILVVREGGRIIFTGSFTFIGSAGAGLGGIYTVPECRGRGVARQATAALAEIALERGPFITLHVAEDNEPARRSYRAAGLVECGTLRLTFR